MMTVQPIKSKATIRAIKGIIKNDPKRINDSRNTIISGFWGNVIQA